ncbi:glycosyltransferase [Streptomyces sp. NPDC051776]|uniref:glycosyltransferase n=1 Tax=Streptomyces sp. NPDC051776 TaxID=3155414 RepID=UPI0034222B23
MTDHLETVAPTVHSTPPARPPEFDAATHATMAHIDGQAVKVVAEKRRASTRKGNAQDGASRAGRPWRLLTLGANPLTRVSFAVILAELYRTGVLQRRFELHQFVLDPGVDGQRPEQVDDVRLHWGGNEPDSTARLRKVMADVRPDVVLLVGEIGHFMQLGSVLAETHLPVLGWFPVNFERITNPRPWQIVLSVCTRVLCQSEFGARQLRRDNPNVAVLPLGVNTEVFTPIGSRDQRALRTELGWDSTGFLFLFVGRNNSRKGVHFAIEAFRLFRALDPAAGDASYLYLHTDVDHRLLELLHGSDLLDRVCLTDDYDIVRNFLSETQLADLYRASDVFLLPSLSEGFGMPLLEAQAAGLPIIATDNSAITEVVGDAGLLIDAPLRIPALDSDCIAWARPPDVDHAARLMLSLYHDAPLRSGLGERGIARAASQTWKAIADALLNELTHLTPTALERRWRSDRSRVEVDRAAPATGGVRADS